MHGRRHARGIGIPVQKIERDGLFAQQVIVDHERPDQVVAAHHVERGRHMGALKVALFVHLFFQAGNLFFIHEDAQFAGFLEIHHGGEESRRLNTLILLGRHIGQGGSQQGAA